MVSQTQSPQVPYTVPSEAPTEVMLPAGAQSEEPTFIAEPGGPGGPGTPPYGGGGGGGGGGGDGPSGDGSEQGPLSKGWIVFAVVFAVVVIGVIIAVLVTKTATPVAITTTSFTSTSLAPTTTSPPPTTRATTTTVATTTLPPEPTAFLTADSASLPCDPTNNVTLTWQTTQANVVTLTGPGGSSERSPSGSESVGPGRSCTATFTDRWTLQAENASGQAQSEVDIIWTVP